MKFNKYIKGKHMINATERLYNLVYKNEGYEEYNKATVEPIKGTKEDTNTNAYKDMTKAEINKLLDDKGIEYNLRDNKDKLIELLLGSD